tara:strand:+ start:23 stop:403 length:381 start_codon:yes stop_codon:yes gene_type:complete
MITKILTGSIIASAFTMPAFSGVYGNIETNAAYTGINNFNSAITDMHLGVEGNLTPNVTGYVQGGPSFVAIDGAADLVTEYSGKAGLGVDFTQKLNAYGEFAFQTDARDFKTDLPIGLKGGIKYSF